MKEHTHEHLHDHDHDGGAHTHEHVHTHTHDGETHAHTHSHDHGHDGEHGHSHGSSVRVLYVLALLLDHWAAHNQDHAVEYQKWVDKLTADGKMDVAGAITEAIALMAQADEHLRAAKKKLTEEA